MKHELSEDIMRAYLHRKLAPAERMRIEKILQDNPELQQDLALLRAEIAASELLIASETRQLFREWQETPTRLSVFRGGPLRWAIGMAITLLLGFAVWQLLLRPAGVPPSDDRVLPQPPAELSTPSPPQPVAVAPAPSTQAVPPPSRPKNYRALAIASLPDPLSTTLRRSTTADSAASLFQQAQDAYAAGQYQRSLELLQETDSARQQSATFLSAHALFQLQRYPEAGIQFERLIDLNSRQFRFRSEWGLLMCRLADRPNSEKAFEKQLNEILAKPQHPYFQQAKTLRKTLEK